MKKIVIAVVLLFAACGSEREAEPFKPRCSTTIAKHYKVRWRCGALGGRTGSW